MGLFTFIKERLSYLVVGLITIAIVAFIVSDVVRNGTPFFRESQNQIGLVGTEKISYDDFNQKLKDKEDQFKAQYRQASLPEQSLHFINDQAWNELVTQIVLNQEINKIGVEVNPGSDEATAMVLGSNPDPQIRQAFTDPQTGIFDRSRITNFLRSMDKDATGDTRKRWTKFQTELLNNRSIQKYLGLIQGGIYTTKIDLNESLNVPQKTSIDYVFLDYNRVPDNKATPSDADLQKYYREHSYLYNIPEELRTIDYVVFQAKPSAEDSSFAKKEIQKLAMDFKAAKDDSLFVSINSESKNPIGFFKKAQLPKILDSNLINQTAGSIYGPYFENGSFKVAKLISVHDMPDSVKSRHILLTDAPQGGAPANYPALLKKADSLKSVIQAGGDFAALAQTYSADKGSAVKGGELGYAGIGVFVKPFQDAIFYGKTGEYKIVQTQFGVHLIQIQDQKNISKSYQIGIIDRPFHPSNKTLQENYAKATSLLSGLVGQDFATYARKQGLTVRSAVDFKAGDAQLTSLDGSRKVVQWAFGAQIGSLSEVIDLGESAVVARLSEIKSKGILPYETVKFQSQALAIKDRKGEILSQQLVDAAKSAHSIDEVATKLNLTPAKADSISFSSPFINRDLTEPALVGAAFGAPEKGLSKPVIGDKGVFLFQVTQRFTTPGPPLTAIQKQIIQSKRNSAENDAVEALKKLAGIVDNRSKFF